ncbi:sorbitol-6-phosphate dehydrogenase [Candidatus Aerophobetes bacterium]|nr:sorbitol-6-phosphate dehydrogenase [Candidatus Aerophobetes bacterium]
MSLENRVAIITGAGQGLGEAIALRLAEEGCKTVIADIDFEKAKKVAQKIENIYGKESLPFKVDVTKNEEVKLMVKRAVEKFSGIDILISNAGILKSYEITQFPEKDWRKIIEVNLTGYFLTAKEVAKIMKKQKRGVIIQINSKSGKKGSLWNSAYAASKFGGIGFTQSIALDLAPYNIRVNAVCPGNLLDSPLWVNSLYEQYAKKWGISKEEVRKRYESRVPLRRGCQYEDVTNLVVFLASDQSSYMTGQAINVTGGEEMR